MLIPEFQRPLLRVRSPSPIERKPRVGSPSNAIDQRSTAVPTNLRRPGSSSTPGANSTTSRVEPGVGFPSRISLTGPLPRRDLERLNSPGKSIQTRGPRRESPASKKASRRAPVAVRSLSTPSLVSCQAARALAARAGNALSKLAACSRAAAMKATRRDCAEGMGLRTGPVDGAEDWASDDECAADAWCQPEQSRHQS